MERLTTDFSLFLQKNKIITHKRQVMQANDEFVAYDYTMPEQRSYAFVSADSLVSEFLVCGKSFTFKC